MSANQVLKIAVIGCVEFSENALKVLINHVHCEVGLVITRQSSAINSDFVDLSKLAIQHDIPFVHVKGNDQAAMANALSAYQPDVIFCVGWSYLLKRLILDIPRYGVVGYHPANIPHNRGRHPLIWALVLGLKETGSTFFLMDEGADTGKILSQKPIPIKDSDYARDLYNAMLAVALGQIEALVSGWEEAFQNAQPQNREGNAWRKRGKSDGKIDWRMSAHNIVNLVRALSEPYPGAHFEHHIENEQQDCIVWQAHEVTGIPENLEPGKVLSVTSEGIVIKCGNNAIQITEYSDLPEMKVGDYL